jgi:phosphoribosylglycinamide formyltransferase-1
MLALARAAANGQIAGRLVNVISDRADAAGLAAARELGVPAEVVAPAAAQDRAAYGRALTARIEACGARLVVLAGFMRILDGEFVRHWQGRLLNIHPSLLPAWRGLHTHRRVLAAGERWHGCTVHFVTEELDAGPAVIQGRLPVLHGDDETSLSARVQRLEHIIFPRAVGWYAAGRLTWRDGAAWLDGQALAQPMVEEEQ